MNDDTNLNVPDAHLDYNAFYISQLEQAIDQISKLHNVLPPFGLGCA